MSETLDLGVIPAHTDEWREQVRAMIRFLAGFDADGARYTNGVGFSGYDSHFGRDMAGLPDARWTAGQYRGCWRLLRKYAKTQLPKGGFDWHTLGDPDENPKPGSRVLGSGAGSIEVDGDMLLIHRTANGRDASLLAVRDLPNRTFNPEGRCWEVPVYLIRPVRDLAERFGFEMSAEVLALPDHDPDRLPVKAHPVGDLLVLSFPYHPVLIASMRLFTEAAWDPDAKTWTVPVEFAPDLLARLAQVGADLGDAQERVLEAARRSHERVLASRALDAELDIPELGMTLRPAQRAAVAYILDSRRPGDGTIGCIEGDVTGTGKTVIAAASIHLTDAWPAVVDVPNDMLARKWRREFHRALPERRVLLVEGMVPPAISTTVIERLEGGDHGGIHEDLLAVLGDDHDPFFGRTDAVADLRKRQNINRTVALLQAADVVIVTFSVLASWAPVLAALRPRGHVVDEVHRCKDPAAQRSKAALQVSQSVPAGGTILGLTATLLINRKSEAAHPLDIVGRLQEFGDVAAIKNDEQLARRLRARCYMRRTHDDLHSELKLIYEPVEIIGEDKAMEEYRKAEKDFLAWLRTWALEKAKEAGIADPHSAAMKRVMRSARAEHLVRVGHLRRLATKAKLPSCIQWARDFIDDSGEKLLVFAEGVDTIEQLGEGLGAPIIYGSGHKHSTDADGRDRLMDQFQTDPDTRAIVLSIGVADVGLDLTAAMQGLFVEHPWSPMTADQCCGRAYARENDLHGFIANDSICLDTIDQRIVQGLLPRKRAECEDGMDGDNYGPDAEERTSVFNDLMDSLLEDAL